MIERIKSRLLTVIRRALLPKDVFDLVEDIGAKNAHKVVENINDYIPYNGTQWQQYFGEVVTIHKNRQSSPEHPKSFLCYITIQEAKYLRSLGLGYSLAEDGEFHQHCGKHNIPSFQGGDGGGSGSGGDGGSGDGGGGRGAGFGGTDGLTGGVHGDKGFSAARAGGYSFGMTSIDDSSSESGFDATSLSWGAFKALEAELGMSGYGANGLGSDVTSMSVWGNQTSFSFDSEIGTFGLESSFSRTSNFATNTHYGTGFLGLNEYSYSGYANPLGSPTNTYSAGFLGSLLGTVLGLSPSTIDSIDTAASVAMAIVFNSPLIALAPVARQMEQQGLIGAETSKALQGAALVGSFMSGMISSVQSIGAIGTAIDLGAISGMQAAVLGATMAYSTYNGFTNMQTGLASLGFTSNVSDMTSFGFSTDGNGNVYLNGIHVTEANFNSSTSSFISWLLARNQYNYNPEFDTFEKMAGSILLNNYLAGGDMWNPMNLIGGNYNNAVGIRSDLNWFAKISMMQEDYTGVVLAKNPI